jgi:hypothetical protein
MNLQRSIDRLIELFGIFRFAVETNNKTGLYDINSLAEDVLIPIFKDVYNCQFLRNLNKEQRNYAGLDLGDDQAGVGFQITSQSGIDKIKETLAQVITHKLYLRYETIYVYVLTQKQKKYNKKLLQDLTKGHFKFDPEEHIVDAGALVNKIRGLDYEVIQRIEQTLEVHFANPKKYFLQPHAPKKTETLTLNLMPIVFPDELYIGRVTYDREEVIRKSWDRKLKMSYKSNERDVARAALEQKGLAFSTEWVVRSREIITFHNLRDETLPLASLIEPTIADPIPVKNYIRKEGGELHNDRLNILKDLLRNTLKSQLWHRGITWQHKERIFIFIDPDGGEIRKERWSGGKKEGRIVYRQVKWEDDPSKLKFHEHLAFEASFDLYDGQWYLAIKPEMFCSFDGYKRSGFNKNRVSFLKRNDHNSDVLTDLLFITEILHKDQKEALLTEAPRPRIKLGELVKLDGAVPIDDKEWLQQHEKKKRKALEKPPKMPLFESHEA